MSFCWGYQGQSRQSYLHLAVTYVHSRKFTSDVTPTILLTDSMVTTVFTVPCMHVSTAVGC